MSSSRSTSSKRAKLSHEKVSSVGTLEGVLATAFVGSRVVDYLDPRSCLMLLSVSKTTRKAAVPKLKAYQEMPAVKHKQFMLDAWLAHPHVGNQSAADTVFRGMSIEEAVGNLAGPLRLSRIQRKADTLKKQFVVLSYETPVYGQEKALVAFFSTSGALQGTYTFKSTLDYETYWDTDCITELWVQSRLLRKKVWFHCGNVKASINGDEVEWGGQWVESLFWDYDLYRYFDGILSPTEVLCVLLHAISTLPPVIFNVLLAHTEGFGKVLNRHAEDLEDQEEADELYEWMDYLKSVDYNVM